MFCHFVSRIAEFLCLEPVPNLPEQRSVTIKHAPLHGPTIISKSSQLYRTPRMPTEKDVELVIDKKF